MGTALRAELVAMAVRTKKVRTGEVITACESVDMNSARVAIPNRKRLLHLQFRRFAGCPFCSLHLRSFVRRKDELAAAGIDEVVVFRSTASALKRHHADVPFTVIPDLHGKLYAQFGVGSGLRALQPRAWAAAIQGVARMLPKLPGLPRWGLGTLGLPADFLIGTDGRVLACKYGVHAHDQWSVDELVTLARVHRNHRTAATTA